MCQYYGLTPYRRIYPNTNGCGDVHSYDAADQVTRVLYDATNSDSSPRAWSNDVRYIIDPAGNWTNRTQISGGTTNSVNYSANSLNEYTQVGGTNFSYDANGNLISDGVWTFTYDCENRLTKATTGASTNTYTYDALGRLILRNDNGTPTRYYYAGWQLIDEQDNSGNLVARYVYGAGLDEVVRMWRNGNYYRYLYDGLGNVSEITGDAGGRWESYLYDVYGNPRVIRNNNGAIISASAIGNRIMFNGRDRDPDTGLYNYRYRYYSPSLGRFVQKDPIGIIGSDFNLYRYVVNNPVNYRDQLGLFVNVENPIVNPRGPAAYQVVDNPPSPGVVLGMFGLYGALAAATYIGPQGLLAMATILDKAKEAFAKLMQKGEPCWTFGQYKDLDKWFRQMQQRGWTPNQITEAIKSGEQFPAQNLINPLNSATRYIHPETGRSVVVDDVTKEIIHIGGDKFLYK